MENLPDAPPPNTTVIDEQEKIKTVLRDVILVFQKHELTQGQYLVTLQCLTSGALSTENRVVEKTYIRQLEKEIKRARKVQIANRPAQGTA